jgi:hypothetical protein
MGFTIPDQQEILRVIEKHVASDLAKPQNLTQEETDLLDKLDAADPVLPKRPES